MLVHWAVLLLLLVISNEAALQNAENELNQIFEKGLSRGKISLDKVEEAKNNLHYSYNLSRAVSYADLVIEAVPEKARN